MPKKRSYDVRVDVMIEEIRTVGATSPEEAAQIAEADVRRSFPVHRHVEAVQVDYRTKKGGESHWYPAR